jgi:hypothetical protein
MLEIVAIAGAVLVLGGVVALVLLRVGPEPVRVFCPTWGVMVEVRGDVCRALDESGMRVGSPWECQRECLMPREAEIARRAAAR